jgi:hypothetical protein
VGRRALPKNGKRYYTIPEVLRKDEIARAMKLYEKCKETKEEFNQRCTKEIVGPILFRVNEHTGSNNGAEYWAYCVEYHISAMSREERQHVLANLNAVE